MAAAQANDLGSFKRGEPIGAADPKTGNTGGFDYFNRGEVFAFLTTAPATVGATSRAFRLALLGVGS